MLAGHSMGAHTALAYALAHPDRLAGLVVIGPAYLGYPDEEALARWDRLADGLEQGGVEGFMRAYDRGLDPAWRDTVLRFTRRRLLEHRHPGAVAQAMREVPRSAPFSALSELEFLRRARTRGRQPRRLRPGPSVRGRGGLRGEPARGAPDQRGGGGVTRSPGRAAGCHGRSRRSARRRQSWNGGPRDANGLRRVPASKVTSVRIRHSRPQGAPRMLSGR